MKTLLGIASAVTIAVIVGIGGVVANDHDDQIEMGIKQQAIEQDLAAQVATTNDINKDINDLKICISELKKDVANLDDKLDEIKELLVTSRRRR